MTEEGMCYSRCVATVCISELCSTEGGCKSTPLLHLQLIATKTRSSALPSVYSKHTTPRFSLVCGIFIFHIFTSHFYQIYFHILQFGRTRTEDWCLQIEELLNIESVHQLSILSIKIDNQRWPISSYWNKNCAKATKLQTKISLRY